MESIVEKIVRELEAQAGSAKGEKAKALKGTVEAALADVEATPARREIIDRLDNLLVVLTEASRDVCSNTRCPHYNKKCKMR
jgi:acetyl-CoA carboxylase alpha subunit